MYSSGLDVFDTKPKLPGDSFFERTGSVSLALFGAFLAFMMEVAEFLLVLHTSSLTMTLSNIVKVKHPL